MVACPAADTVSCQSVVSPVGVSQDSPVLSKSQRTAVPVEDGSTFALQLILLLPLAATTVCELSAETMLPLPSSKAHNDSSTTTAGLFASMLIALAISTSIPIESQTVFFFIPLLLLRRDVSYQLRGTQRRQNTICRGS